MDPKARDKVSEAIWAFFDNYRFYYYILTSMARVEDKTWCPSMGVGFIRGNIPTLFYNPDWVNERTHEEMMCTLNHECQHIGLRHLERLGSRERMIANLAMDVIVNSNIPQLNNIPEFKENLITQDSFEELKKSDVREMLWEEVYDLIKPGVDKKRDEAFQKMMEQIGKTHEGWDKDGAGQEQECDACGGTGKDKDGNKCEKCDGTGKTKAPSGMGYELTPEQQAAMKGLMKEAAKKLNGRDAGNLPGAIRRLVDHLIRPKFNWKQQLSIFAQSSAKEEVEQTWKRVNRRFGVVAPGKKKEYRPRLLGVIDNSGSVDKKTYDAFVGHICKIAEACEAIDGIGVDTRVNFEFEFKKGKTPAHEDNQSGGGTMFQPAFDYAKEKGVYDGIIYFTDGYNFDRSLNTYKIPTIFAICPNGKEMEGHRNVKVDTDEY